MTSVFAATHQVKATKFGFFTAEDVRAMSICQISHAKEFDLVGLAVKGGLYDGRMGPLYNSQVCETCGMESKFCPGHFGHIELSFPVVHPLLWDACVRLMKAKCFLCHRFKVRSEVAAEQMQHLLRGDIVAAQKAGAGQRTLLDQVQGVAYLSGLHAQRLRRHLVEDYLKACVTTQHCQHCQAYSPKLSSFRKEKLFAMPLKDNLAKKNVANRRVLPATVFNRRDHKLVSKDDADMMEVDEDEAPQDVDDADEDEDEEDADDDYQSNSTKSWVTPREAQEHIRLLWEKESVACASFWGEVVSHRKALERRTSSPDVFFLEALAVVPNKFRPVNHTTGNEITSHLHNKMYRQVIMLSERMMHNRELQAAAVEEEARARLQNQLVSLWLDLQKAVNFLIESKDQMQPGIKGLMEKKEGVFRMNLMGKRVNYACRSVISPDPYIATDEVGLPLVFARKLTFPERVTRVNCKRLALAVRNGPHKHPGALYIEDGTLRFKLKAGGNEGWATRIEALEDLVVHRHLISGDYVIANRQPTLHRPSMMGHKARVLAGDHRVIRLHYANCNSYNADFDGDEMNVHLPQDQQARAEIAELMIAGKQYLLPKDGSPLRGLIQDHILAGVLMSMRDTFFNEADFQLLLYSACFASNVRAPYTTPMPAIIKPRPLWTGKQLISAVIKRLLHGNPMFNYDGKTKVKASYWGPTGTEEGQVIIRGGDMLQGIMDKAQLGSVEDGFIHTCHILYGGTVAEQLMTSFARLFTKYLQLRGYSVGTEDLLLTPEGDALRQRQLDVSSVRSTEVAAQALNKPNLRGPALFRELGELARRGKDAHVDMEMKRMANEITSRVNSDALPAGLHKPWPANNFLLMVSTGAKGSLVNFGMISGLLGQMELEGQRVPLTLSGRTLPSFMPHDPNVRARGYIAHRFLTGIPPQEYFFHSMAGREGLVDTAVKTASSGYLQRCLVKHLESIVTQYDGTVREASGAVMQLRLGGDGLDPMVSPSLYKMELISRNFDVVLARSGLTRQQLLTQTPLVGHAYSERFQEALDEFCRTKENLDPQFAALMRNQYTRCSSQAGDGVGLLAAQSLGEPSTQLTLNTFHLAGLGAVNVTLGIPRLRELIMTAQKPKTPVSYLPFAQGLDTVGRAKAKDLFLNVLLWNLVSSLHTKASPFMDGDLEQQIEYVVSLRFDPRYEQLGISWETLCHKASDAFAVMVALRCNKVAKQHREAIHVHEVSHSQRADDDAPGGRNATQQEESDDEVDGDDADGPPVSDSFPDSMRAQGLKRVSKRKLVSKYNNRASAVMMICSAFASKEEARLEMQFSLSVAEGKVLMDSVVEECARSFSVRNCVGIQRVVEDPQQPRLTFEGANFYSVWARAFNSALVDLHQFTTNDVLLILDVLGVEAARQSFINEVVSVFKVYGISIDDRHISLVGDYVTFEGGYRGMNRHTMNGGVSSPLLRMSFETSMKFMLQSAQNGDVDELQSPSACVAVGSIAKMGTGMVEVRVGLE